jgi:prephenate dehydratase
MDIKLILEHFRCIMPNITEQEAYDMVQPVTDIITDIYSENQTRFPILANKIKKNRDSIVFTLKEEWGR